MQLDPNRRGQDDLILTMVASPDLTLEDVADFHNMSVMQLCTWAARDDIKAALRSIRNFHRTRAAIAAAENAGLAQSCLAAMVRTHEHEERNLPAPQALDALTLRARTRETIRKACHQLMPASRPASRKRTRRRPQLDHGLTTPINTPLEPPLATTPPDAHKVSLPVLKLNGLAHATSPAPAATLINTAGASPPAELSGPHRANFQSRNHSSPPSHSPAPSGPTTVARGEAAAAEPLESPPQNLPAPLGAHEATTADPFTAPQIHDPQTPKAKGAGKPAVSWRQQSDVRGPRFRPDFR